MTASVQAAAGVVVSDSRRREMSKPAVTCTSASTVPGPGPSPGAPRRRCAGRGPHLPWPGASSTRRAVRRRRAWCAAPTPAPGPGRRGVAGAAPPVCRRSRGHATLHSRVLRRRRQVSAWARACGDADSRTRGKGPHGETGGDRGRGAVGLRPGRRQVRVRAAPPGHDPGPGRRRNVAPRGRRLHVARDRGPAPHRAGRVPRAWPTTSTTSTPPGSAARAGRCSWSTPWRPSPRARSTRSCSPTGRPRAPT